MDHPNEKRLCVRELGHAKTNKTNKTNNLSEPEDNIERKNNMQPFLALVTPLGGGGGQPPSSFRPGVVGHLSSLS